MNSYSKLVTYSTSNGQKMYLTLSDVTKTLKKNSYFDGFKFQIVFAR